MNLPRISPTVAPQSAARNTALLEKAKELEAAFLAEMLGHAGRDGMAADSFNGGIGEEQFASFLRAEEARLLVERGGIGLAESLFRAMGGDKDG